ncbi:MAG: hypothetical protein K2J12_03730 [Muribaculaceae bacterium]|nr:hypothetical protein [Muribaculaceae bacterium]
MKVYDQENSPAARMTNQSLPNGWIVKDRIKKDSSQTGSAYSICYYAEKDGKSYFLKVYDLNAYLKGDEAPERRVKEMTRMLNQYDHEKNISQFCRERGASNVACIIEANVTESDEDRTPIPYLIFERADGDVRKFLETSENVDTVWKFKSLHEVAVGLQQLHMLKVYHQDIKPSNILTFNGDSKLGDLGRAVKDLSLCPFFDDVYWGDKTYLAPEVAYSSEIGKDERRMLLTDLYLLGSLITYYFFYLPYNGFIYKKIPANHHYLKTALTYSEILEELKEAHSSVIEQFQRTINLHDKYAEEKLIQLIDALCNPDFNHRHHPSILLASTINGESNISIGVRYGLEKVISSFDWFHKRFLYNLKK